MSKGSCHVGGAAASPQLLRRVNAGVILRTLRGAGVMTGTDLMAATGLTRATVMAVADDLVTQGWVKEVETQRQVGDRSKGRPARRFTLRSRAAYVAGASLEYGRVIVVLADLLGDVVARTARPVHAGAFEDSVGHPEAWRQELLAGVDQVLQEAGVREQEVLAATIAVPAPVGSDGDVSRLQAFWRSFDVRGAFAERYDWHIEVENDANLAALAERWCGSGAGVENLVVLLAGERMGSGIIEAGRVLRGQEGGFGELQFLDFVEGVGDTLGITAVAAAWGRAALSGDAPVLSGLCGGDAAELTAEMVFTAAADGDVAAREVVERIAQRMALVVAVISTFTNPDVIILDGAADGQTEMLLPMVGERLPQLTSTPPRVLASGLSGASVELGAVRRALDYVEANAFDLTLPEASARP